MSEYIHDFMEDIAYDPRLVASEFKVLTNDEWKPFAEVIERSNVKKNLLERLCDYFGLGTLDYSEKREMTFPKESYYTEFLCGNIF